MYHNVVANKRVISSIHKCYYSQQAEVLHQGHLHSAIRELFPHENILFNARKDTQLKDNKTGSNLELDVWIPSLNICFEFQDAYHYTTAFYTQKSVETVKHKDNVKLKKLEARGDTLVYVPCWWDGSVESLAASIRNQRPDLLVNKQISKSPIPMIPPSNFFQPFAVPNVGELMVATFPPLELSYSISIENSWWLSEKYDGVRCCWNNISKQLYSRTGVIINLPLANISHFPDSFIDSELWFGRGLFNECRNFIQSLAPHSNSSLLRVIAFDDASPQFETHPFETRYEFLLREIYFRHPFMIIAPQKRCITRKQLNKEIKETIEDGGEGVILRKPKTLYEHGKSQSLLKLKASRDKEALVVRVKGKSILLQLPEGLTFWVSAENVKPRPRPFEGEVVTFSYRSYVNSSPFFPVVERVRRDITWQDVIVNHLRDRPHENILSDISLQVLTADPRTYGSYVHTKRKKIRKYFEFIARELGRDPLVADHWYSFPFKQFTAHKGVKSLLSLFGGSVVNALLYLFPEIGLEGSKFNLFSPSYWNNVGNRRNYISKFAKEKGFDALRAENWYSFTIENLGNTRAKDIIKSYYGSNVAKALIHLFPEIGLERNKFASLPRNYYYKRILDEFAKSQQFDPLVADNWLPFLDIDYFKQLCQQHEFILRQYPSLREAVLDCYPNMNGDFLSRKRSSYWENAANRKSFFDEFALAHDFDALVPSNWYATTREMILQQNGGISVLKYYDNLNHALREVYPNIELDPTYNFRKGTPQHVFYANKLFFDNFAKKNEFDSLIPDNWYSVSRDQVLSLKGGNSILEQFGGSMAKALVHAYPNIGIELKKFKSLKNYWGDFNNRRNFFVEYAKANQFDPLFAINWYSKSYWDIHHYKKASSVMSYYKGDFTSALIHLFPDIGLVESNFVRR